jgi:hypothetical protein
MARNGTSVRAGLLVCSLAAHVLIIIALTHLQWEVEFCDTCGNRFETAKLQELRLGSIHYQTRLGTWFADPSVCVDCCPHRKLRFVSKGGWEQLLAGLSETSQFKPETIEEGRRHARRGRSLIDALFTYKAKSGSWPKELSDCGPGGLPQGTNQEDWDYCPRAPSSFDLYHYAHTGDWMLYYEPGCGWLMAPDADTRPIMLGQEP